MAFLLDGSPAKCALFTVCRELFSCLPSVWRLRAPSPKDKCRADSRFAPCQWETALLCNDVSHWLGASLRSALQMSNYPLPCTLVYWWAQTGSLQTTAMSTLVNTSCHVALYVCLTHWDRNKMADMMQTALSKRPIDNSLALFTY